MAAYTTFGTNRANAYKILEDSLNLRDVRIYDTVEDADGKERRVLNAKETTLAAQKQQAIREAFKDWKMCIRDRNRGRKPVNGCAATGGRCNAFGAGKPMYFKAFPAPFVRCRMFSPEPLKTVFETVTFPPPQGMSFLPLRGPIFSGKELNPHG